MDPQILQFAKEERTLTPVKRRKRLAHSTNVVLGNRSTLNRTRI